MPGRRTVLRCAAAIGLLSLGRAHALEAPTGTVVLTLTGQLRTPNAGQEARFDMAMLERLPQRDLLRDVLRAAGARGTVLRARALNDYHVDIPYQDTQRFDIIIARLLDGAPMLVRDRGPLFVIYPFDAHAELRNAIYYSRSAWQLRSIEVQ